MALDVPSPGLVATHAVLDEAPRGAAVAILQLLCFTERRKLNEAKLTGNSKVEAVELTPQLAATIREAARRAADRVPG